MASSSVNRALLARIQSEQFHCAFERCIGRGTPYRPIDGSAMGMPALICAAFAVEVGMKSILMHFGTDPQRTHNLQKLFDNLPLDISSRAKCNLSNIYPNFDQLLSQAEDAFAKWRYFYESENPITIDISFVGNLSAFLQVELDRLFPYEIVSETSSAASTNIGNCLQRLYRV